MEVPGDTNFPNFHKPNLFFPSITNPLDPSTKYLQSPATRDFYCLTTGCLYQAITPTNQLSVNLHHLLQREAQLPLPLKQPTPTPQQEPSKIIQGPPKQAYAASKTTKKKNNKKEQKNLKEKPPVKPNSPKEKPALSTQDKIVKKNLKEKTQVKPASPKEKPALSTQDKIVKKNLKEKTQVKPASPKEKPASSIQDKIVKKNLKEKTQVKPASPKENPASSIQDKIVKKNLKEKTQVKPASPKKKPTSKALDKIVKKKLKKKTKNKPASAKEKPASCTEDKIVKKRKKLVQLYRKIKSVPTWTFLKPFNRRPRPKKIKKHHRKDSGWGSQLKNCIMASAIHEIIHSRFAKNENVHMPQPQLRALLNSGDWKQRTDQAWMRHMEEEAIYKYKKNYFEKHKTKLKVKGNDIFHHPEKPWLVSVFRSVINKDEKESWPLLVKCLYKHSDSTLRHASKHRSFCLTWDDISYSLRSDHAYYTQIQCLMAITDTLYAELLVHTNKETTVVRVYFDCDFWEQTEEKLDAFYINNVLPYLRKNKTNLSSDLSK